MPKKYRVPLFVILCVGVLTAGAGAFFALHNRNFQVLNPRGTIASQERDLMIIAALLAIVVIVPVFAMTFTFAWKYRASNTKAKYTPDADKNVVAETAWWLIPFVIIGVLSVITWVSSHSLDPFKPIAGGIKPLKIEVVALQWRWLFIYPEQHIATVNLAQLPVGQPVEFDITSDAPMNSFWIPQLGGQIYAMSGMNTQLHLVADKAGDYAGSSANISGSGFADMRFTARASSRDDFDEWVRMAQSSSEHLGWTAYSQLAKPSKDETVRYFSSPDPTLYDTILMKYMGHGDH